MGRDSKGKFIKGNKHSDEVKEKMKLAKLGKPNNSSTKFAKGDTPYKSMVRVSRTTI